MPGKATVYDVLISCPRDVQPYVNTLENVISRFNNFYGREKGIVLRPISWLNNSFPQFGASPQKILNKQIVDAADFSVSVFWTRFGTPTEDFGSGTEEEIEHMLAAHKQVFLYFLDKALPPSQVDQTQYQKIQLFKEKHKNEGLFFSISDENELERHFREHLELYTSSMIHDRIYPKSTRTKLILWVDDCPENNIYVRRILEQYGLQFDLALSTERAICLLENKKNHYSLVISDMGRKEGAHEGYALLKQIRDSGNEVPFVIFSVDGSSPEHRAEAAHNGAQWSTDSGTEVVNIALKLLLSS